MSYCQFVTSGKAHPVHVEYHDLSYGFPVPTDDGLFERLILEINQAGLSWEAILKKQEGFRSAYDGFVIERVASYGEEDVARLLGDSRIIRNRLKVGAAVHNARVVLGLQEEFGSFAAWLDHHHPLSLDQWVRLFKQTFHFTGGEICNEFLMSAGYLPGAHDPDCPIAQKVLEHNPAWAARLPRSP